MSARLWSTKLKDTPSEKSVKIINNVCQSLINDKIPEPSNNPRISIWLLNCIVYATIITWALSNNVKCEIVDNSNKKSSGNNYSPQWLIKLDNQIKNTRKFISKCEAERMRLTKNARLTRRMARNRAEIQSLLHETPISVMSLTRLIEKKKRAARTLVKRRTKKLRNWQRTKFNASFMKDQKSVFDTFNKIIDADPENLKPTFKCLQSTHSQPYFEDPQEVENFWRTLWDRADPGNPNAAWLDEIKALFQELVPEVHSGPIQITSDDVWNGIRRKKNWSGTGPDKTANFWWKKLTSTHKVVREMFEALINTEVGVDSWFPEGRTILIPKDGPWSVENQRPITCTNNMYKWFSSILLNKLMSHLEKYRLVQVDQRGARAKCSGTTNNLLIDDMVLRDARYNRKNLSCTWIDVRKAFDSLSHSWMKHMLELHRVPRKITNAISNLIDNWSVVITIPTRNGTAYSTPIKFRNGELQGDCLGPNLYILATNPIAWKLRCLNGYTLSKPISTTITHSLFIDDLKKYDRDLVHQRTSLESLREMMKHAGLEWNEKKCKVLHIRRGVLKPETGDIVMSDGFTLKSLNHEESYRFLGVPESNLHNLESLVESITKRIHQRANVVWSSPLSDYNKIMACNSYVNGVAEYYFWSEKFRLEDLKRMDIAIRDALNRTGAKHPQQLNDLLYLPKAKGGRGLRSLEQSYKETKVKTAIKILQSDDPQMCNVALFNKICMSKNRASIFTDAIKYAQDLGMELVTADSVQVHFFTEEGESITTKDLAKVKLEMQRRRNELYWKNILESTWQGVIYHSRANDTTLIPGCYDWLFNWRSAPSDVIREIFCLYTQTIKTKTFEKIRSENPPPDEICRLCKNGKESVKHILSNCSTLAKHAYLLRHDRTLKCFMFQVLKLLNLIEICPPPWFSPMEVKPYYKNQTAEVWWNLPEYTTGEEETDVFIPDGKIVLKQEKVVFIVEMTVPWIDTRDERYAYKIAKYHPVRQNTRLLYPDYEVIPLTLVIDVLGGYSSSLPQNIGKLCNDKHIVNKVIKSMQKVVLSEAVHISRRFKLSVQNEERM